ncbi:hypothetical protein HPE56_19260 [Maribacter sp. ANRC-HE7]|uniref:Carboxypeptidase regulatory-like domain-containing protein n=1 Tax=Maribacter aquimaris TaxID=2737171 RepID=A0ABR7V9D5_9FLAO|nr:hypothetical protein [Maribacter aquimaris]MBD0779942.1 hypothetical protein [Maribacter aquimaris]
MNRKIVLIFILVGICTTLLKCTLNEKEKIGVFGHLQDDFGNPLGNVSIFYKSNLTSVQTDSLGNYTIDTPRIVFIEFKKEGYQTLATKIDNFSELGSYNLKTVILKKTNTTEVEYKDLYHTTKPKQQSLKLSGNVITIFNDPIKNTKVTLMDSTKHSTTSETQEYNRGFFSFRKYNHELSLEKKGFRALKISLYTYEENNPKIRLLEKSNRKGISLINSRNYISLPKTNLLQKSKSKETTYLLVFAGRSSTTDFFYPNNKHQFKIEKDTLIRFAIFNEGNTKLCKIKDTSNYLCTVKHKYGSSFTKGNFVEEKVIYPSELCIDCSDEPSIVELKLDTIGSNYVFVNSKNKKGYYFTY